MTEINNEQIQEEIDSKQQELQELQVIQNHSNDILEKELTHPNGDKKKIKDIVLKGDIYTRGDKVIFRHGGILRMIEYVGAEPLDPQRIDSFINEKGSAFVFYCPIKFPNGEISRWGMGEANEQNTESFGKNYKANQAIIRGYSRSFLHSKYIGLYDVYSEGEADEFNQQILQISELQRRINMLEKQIGQLKNRNNNLSKNAEMLGIELKLTKEIAQLPTTESLILPKDDKKYPNQSIITVLHETKDGAYTRELMETLPEQHPIKILLLFLVEKAKIDKNNNGRYNLYATALELLKELKSPAVNTMEPDTTHEESVTSFFESINNTTEVNATSKESESVQVTLQLEEEKEMEFLTTEEQNQKDNDIESDTILEEETTQENNQKSKNTPNFLDELDEIINLEELAEVKHTPEPAKEENTNSDIDTPKK